MGGRDKFGCGSAEVGLASGDAGLDSPWGKRRATDPRLRVAREFESVVIPRRFSIIAELGEGSDHRNLKHYLWSGCSPAQRAPRARRGLLSYTLTPGGP